MDWTEGKVHVEMRRILRQMGWTLVAGEYPGGSDHELYPLNVIDPEIARDGSPDPRRHSKGELIPDLVALRGRDLLIAEAKLAFSDSDASKLIQLTSSRLAHLHLALAKFADERDWDSLLPVESLILRPTLVFLADKPAPPPLPGFSHLRVKDGLTAYFEGALSEESN